MHHHLILKVVTKTLVGMILLFGLYVQFHGDYSPGGGFQAGVIFAAAFILYGIVMGLEKVQMVLLLLEKALAARELQQLVQRVVILLEKAALLALQQRGQLVLLRL